MPQAITFAGLSDQPDEFLSVQQYEIPKPGVGEVLVRMLAAPINQQDIMVLAGRYPVKPDHHQGGDPIPGYDGVAEILECGDGVTGLHAGDRVIPKRHGLGTWRTHAALRESSLIRVSSTVDPTFAASMRMCVAPAYLLLEDMAKLKPGDWIIQNAASGYIGRMTCQFARLRGVHTISIIRDRADAGLADHLKAKLRDLGADIVLTDSELSDMESLGKGKRIMLALDAVFGPLAAKMAAHLSPNATFVNYGSLGVEGRSGFFKMTQDLIFWKQITFRHFRLSACLATRSEEEIQDMLNWFVRLVEDGVLKVTDVDIVPWDSHAADADAEVRLRRAIAKAGARRVNESKKQMLWFSY
ncbi:hypothetical protein JMJ35_002441 [Cladonia borealis]|uniref:enoyl-[acyl-carrier-protein] reductase n=1 Tax=Cladonia borealis TaxID=184061 RepID=A0AA39R534_9LECA|nr:hypothetical protein JMJ35_002441 [Cladonia borealis]